MKKLKWGWRVVPGIKHIQWWRHRGGAGGNSSPPILKSWQKFSMKNGIKLVGYTFRLKNYVKIPPISLRFFRAGAATEHIMQGEEGLWTLFSTYLYLKSQCLLLKTTNSPYTSPCHDGVNTRLTFSFKTFSRAIRKISTNVTSLLCNFILSSYLGATAPATLLLEYPHLIWKLWSS